MKKINMNIKKSQIKTRVTWGFNPVTRIVPEKKNYSRKNFNKKTLLKEVY